jgi:hypothetical protein
MKFFAMVLAIEEANFQQYMVIEFKAKFIISPAA